MTRLLILFGKPPVAGRVKTRLVPWISAEEAAKLYGAFLGDIVRARRPAGIVVELHVAPPVDEPALQTVVGGEIRWRPQRGDDLSARLIHAFEDAFAAGATHIVVRNTDSPLLPVAREQEAMDALADGAEIVLGPDRGGGYYLVGLDRPRPELFRAAPMSVATNFERTLAAARAMTSRVVVLGDESDVDEPDDVRALAAELLRMNAASVAPRTSAALAELHLDGLGSGR